MTASASVCALSRTKSSPQPRSVLRGEFDDVSCRAVLSLVVVSSSLGDLLTSVAPSRSNSDSTSALFYTHTITTTASIIVIPPRAVPMNTTSGRLHPPYSSSLLRPDSSTFPADDVVPRFGATPTTTNFCRAGGSIAKAVLNTLPSPVLPQFHLTRQVMMHLDLFQRQHPKPRTSRVRGWRVCLCGGRRRHLMLRI